MNGTDQSLLTITELWSRFTAFIQREAAQMRQLAAARAARCTAITALFGPSAWRRPVPAAYILTVPVGLATLSLGAGMLCTAFPSLPRPTSFFVLCLNSLIVLSPAFLCIALFTRGGLLHPVVTVALAVLVTLKWFRGLLGIELPPDADERFAIAIAFGLPTLALLSYALTLDAYERHPAFPFVAHPSWRYPFGRADLAKLTELRHEWVRYRTGKSKYQGCIADVLANPTYLPPLPSRPWQKRSLWRHFFAHRFYPPLLPVAERLFFEGRSLDPDALHRSEPLFVQFLEANLLAFDSRLEHERQALAGQTTPDLALTNSSPLAVIPPPVAPSEILLHAPTRDDFISILARGDIRSLAEELVEAQLRNYAEVRNRPLAFWRKLLHMPPETLTTDEQVQVVLKQLTAAVDQATVLVKSQAGFSREYREAMIAAKTAELDFAVTEAKKQSDMAEEEARLAEARKRQAEALRQKREAEHAASAPEENRRERKRQAELAKEIAELNRDQVKAAAEIRREKAKTKADVDRLKPKPPSDPVKQEQERAQERSARESARQAARRIYEQKMTESLAGLDPTSIEFKRTKARWERLILEEQER